MNASKIISIVFTTLVLCYFDYGMGLHYSPVDIVFREFYLIPVFLGAYWFGRKGAILSATGVSAVFLPGVVLNGQEGSVLYWSNLLELASFFVFGLLVGYLRELRDGHLERRDASVHREEMRKFLLCFEKPEDAERSTKYILEHFPLEGNTHVTVMGVVREPSPDIFENQEEHLRVADERRLTAMTAVSESKSILVQGGLPEDRVETKVLRIQQGKAADKILQEQQHNHYDTIILGCNKMAKTEEFILGNMNVSLVREARCPVLTVCGT